MIMWCDHTFGQLGDFGEVCCPVAVQCFVRCAWWWTVQWSVFCQVCMHERVVVGGGGAEGGGASYSSGDQTEWGMCKWLQCLLVLERVCLAILV